MSLSTLVKGVQDIMRKDAGVDGDAQRISQLCWMLFLKVFDAREEEWELENDDYKSPIPKKLRWREWAADDEGITGDALLDFVNNVLFPKLKSLSATEGQSLVVRSVFEDAYNYMKNGTLLRQVVNKLNEIDFHTQSERHQLNDIYEKLLKDLQSAGNAGEFYTPRAVTQLMTLCDELDVKLVQHRDQGRSLMQAGGGLAGVSGAPFLARIAQLSVYAIHNEQPRPPADPPRRRLVRSCNAG